MTSTRPREGRGIRNAVGGEHDRLKRAVLQPVQCWDKKWAESKNGKPLQVFKWVRSDRQVDFDDDDDDDEIEQITAPRPTEEEVGTPVPALPTLQDADDTSASTPAQIGEDDDEEDLEIGKEPSKKLSAATTTTATTTASSTAQHHTTSTEKSTTALPSVITTSSSPVKTRATSPKAQIADDDDDDTDSSRPLVFTPSLETPIETQANTPQDFESMSPAPDVLSDDRNREVQVELVVKGLDEGQAEMEDEMEEVVVKEKEHEHEHDHNDTTMDIESGSAPSQNQHESDSQMDIDPPLNVDA
ncbi:hypothetical protein BG004_008272 [Podila humilis]|nr:hypothetical protein BG004_008272 [Podila humilis]